MGAGATIDDNTTAIGLRLQLARSFARERTSLAFFAGSEETWPARSALREIHTDPADPEFNTRNRVVVEMTDWWGLKADLDGGAKVPVGPAEREKMVQRMANLAASSTFALCPRGNGGSSMRLIEAMGGGALPVLLDDWTTPFGEVCRCTRRLALGPVLPVVCWSEPNLHLRAV